MNLVFNYYATDGVSYGNQNSVPFEFESKEAFFSMVYKRFESVKYIDLFGFTIFEESFYDSNTIEVLTLDEWFIKFKEEAQQELV